MPRDTDPTPTPAAAGARRRPSRRRPVAAGLAIGGLLALAAVATAEHRGWPMLREPVVAAASRVAGVPVRIDGGFALHLFGEPRLHLGRLVVGAAPGPPAPHLADGRDVTVAWRWRDAWRAWRGGPVRLTRLTASALDLRLLRDAQGRATWRIGAASGPGRRDRDAVAAAPSDPVVERLGVAEGRIVLDDAVTATGLLIALQGDTAADGDWHAQVQGRWRGLPIDLALRAGAPLPLLRHEGPAGDDPTDAATTLAVQGRVGEGRVRFEGRAAALLGTPRLDGDLRLSGASLAALAGPLGLTVPATPAFTLDGRIAHSPGRWRLRVREASIGSSRLAGEFDVDTTAAPPRLIGRLTGARLALADLGPAVGRPATPASAGGRRTPPSARVLPQRPLDLPALHRMDADVRVAIDELDFGTAALAPWRGLQGRIGLAGGVLSVDELQASAGGGRLAGTARIEARPGEAAPPRARFATRLRLDDIAVERWLVGGRTNGTPPLAGRLGGTVEADGHGRSTGEVLATLTGDARLVLRDGRVSHLLTEAIGLDVAQALGVALTGDRGLPLRCARLDLQARDGVVAITRGVMDNRDSTLRVSGRVDLRDESLALVARARPKDFSPLSLRMPVAVAGTLADPRVDLQGERLAGRLLGSVALAAVLGPLGAWLPLADRGERPATDPCADAPAPPAATRR